MEAQEITLPVLFCLAKNALSAEMNTQVEVDLGQAFSRVARGIVKQNKRH